MPIPAHLSRLAGPALRLQPDSRLVELVREGQERAFEEIVRRYRGPLTGFASGIVPAHRAEDVVQESLSKALETIRRDDREIALKAWLYTIVRNRALNDLRDEPVHEEISLQHDGVPQPPDIAARRAEVASLVVGIKGLPEQQREAIVQRELSGLGHEQIAGNLGVSAGAVRQLIFRARSNLREGFGILIPLPVLRQILEAAAVRSAGADAAIAGGGGAVAVKLGIALLATGAAVGGGAALEHRAHHSLPDPVNPAVAEAAPAHHHPARATGAAAAQPGKTGSPASGASRAAQGGGNDQGGAKDSPASSPGTGQGPSPNAGSPQGSDSSGSNSGPGSGSGNHSGSGSESGDDSGNSGGDDGGSSGPSGSDHSGSDHSGHGPSGDDGGTSGGDDVSGDEGDTSGDDDPVVSDDSGDDGHGGPGPSSHGDDNPSGDGSDD